MKTLIMFFVAIFGCAIIVLQYPSGDTYTKYIACFTWGFISSQIVNRIWK